MNKLLHGPMTALRCDGADADTVAEVRNFLCRLAAAALLSGIFRMQAAAARFACLRRSRAGEPGCTCRVLPTMLAAHPSASPRHAPPQTLANMEALERMFGLSEEEGMTPAQAQKVKAAAGKR